MTKKETTRYVEKMAKMGITYKPYIMPKEESRWLNSFGKNYGISYDNYQNILKEQNGVCAICGFKNETKKLCIDHDHETELVRGLLCNNCNWGLGHFKDNINLLKKAIEYLSPFQPNSETVREPL